jgi:hypothetical protein
MSSHLLIEPRSMQQRIATPSDCGELPSQVVLGGSGYRAVPDFALECGDQVSNRIIWHNVLFLNFPISSI